MARSGIDRTPKAKGEDRPRARLAMEFGPISWVRFGRPANDNRMPLALLLAVTAFCGAAAVSLIYAIARWVF